MEGKYADSQEEDDDYENEECRLAGTDRFR